MKRKYIILLSIPAAVLFCLYSFTSNIGKPADTVSAYYNDIMENLFSEKTRWASPGTFSDTTIKITLKNRYNEGTYTAYPASQCKSSPAYMYYAFYIPLDSSAYWNYYSFSYNKKVQNRFTKLFGKNIISKRMPTKYQSAGDVHEFRFYSGAAMDAAFKKLYKKPTEKFRGFSLQRIYDLTLQSYCRDAGEVICKVKRQDSLFVKLSKNYLKGALNDSTFEGQSFTHEACKQLGFDPEKERGICIPAYYHERIVGIMLRRQCDGSLPALLKCLKTLLKDYDPAYYEKIKTSF
ncbi:MAG: hypothetical protein IAF38_07115 [Bacteroidia bacterium]|nr:hypothetical protein [Bacteroidia bacterium]